MGNNLAYSLKVCLSSAILSPGVIILVDTVLLNSRYNDVWQSLQNDMLISLGLTVPVWLCFYFITRYVNASPQFFAGKKVILSISATFLAFAPVIFWLFFNLSYFLDFNIIDLIQPLVHALFMILAIYIFKLRPNIDDDQVYGDYKAEDGGQMTEGRGRSTDSR